MLQQKRYTIAALALLLPASLTLAGIQSLSSITEAARLFAIQHAQRSGFVEVTAEARRLDNRLRLAPCPTPLETFATQPQRVLGKTTVGVRCSAGEKPWTLYVSVSASAYLQVPVLANTLPRGTIIQASDLRLVRREINQSQQQILTNQNLIVGKQLKRSVTEGATLNHRMLQSPKIVKRGQQITLIASSGGLEVKVSGKAMGSGAAGDRIQVKNLSSGKLVQGVINEDGTIRVN